MWAVRRFCLVIVAAAATLSAIIPAYAEAERRIALVIGNGKYLYSTPLPNPANDARVLVKILSEIGFEVVSGTDLDRSGMEQLLRDFLAKASGAKVALLFYAGHGLQVDGRNYLVPVDAKLDTVSDLNFGTIELDRVLASLDDPARASIIILDACRDNPLARSFASRTRSGSVGAGLAPYTALGTGTLIAFSTSPGRVAEDGSDRNSPFTVSLARHIATPGLEVRQMLTRVRSDVAVSTAERQIPWDNSSLRGDVYLAGRSDAAQTAPAPQPAASPADEAARAWAATRETTSVAVLEEFIRQFNATPYGAMGRARLEEIKRSQIALAPSSDRITPTAEPLADLDAIIRGAPNGVSVDRNVLRLTMTHPFFANAPPMKPLGYAVNIATKDVIAWNNDTKIRSLARGIVQGNTTSEYGSKQNKTDRGITYRDDTQDVNIMAGNGFLDLVMHRNGVYLRDRGRESYVSNWTTVAIDRLSGSLFPVAVGQRLGFRTSVAFDHNGKPSDKPFVNEYTCETTQRRAASEFHSSFTGDAFVVECKSVTGSRSVKVFFDKLGLFIEADTLKPELFRGDKTRHRTLTNFTTETAERQ